MWGYSLPTLIHFALLKSATFLIESGLDLLRIAECFLTLQWESFFTALSIKPWNFAIQGCPTSKARSSFAENGCQCVIG